MCRTFRMASNMPAVRVMAASLDLSNKYDWQCLKIPEVAPSPSSVVTTHSVGTYEVYRS